MTYRLHHALEGSARRFPDRVAVIDEERELTYTELDAAANRVANLLADLGVQRGDRVGLYLPKSLEAIAGLYGIMKAGAAYVPMDPYSPAAARASYILADCGIEVVITGSEMAERWSEIVAADTPLTHLVVVDADSMDLAAPGGVKIIGRDAIDTQPSRYTDARGLGQDLAYILYTSGSTGVPKGVKLSHLNGLTYVRWLVDYFDATEHDRFSNQPPLHFDMSVADIFGAALVGAALVLVPHTTSMFPIQVKRFIEDYGITVWYSVPSVLAMLVRRGDLELGSLPSLRIISFAGEVFPTKYLGELMRLVPTARYINQYGPTETNVCTYYEVPAPPPLGGDIPIGRPISNVDTFVLTDAGTEAMPGEVGELCVRGSTVMGGYWGDPEKTRERLVPDPVQPELAGRVYRTGDLVCRNRDGDYLFLGRRDTQIKSRGYRIELGEIETALNTHAQVRECAVLPVPDPLVTNKLLAYLAFDGVPDERELRAYCRERLPPYMIPDFFRVSETLPKTSTGKIDRRSLADEIAGDEEGQ